MPIVNLVLGLFAAAMFFIGVFAMWNTKSDIQIIVAVLAFGFCAQCIGFIAVINRSLAATPIVAGEAAAAQAVNEAAPTKWYTDLFTLDDGSFVVVLPDGKAIAQLNGQYCSFDSVADVRRIRKDGSMIYHEATAAQEQKFLAEVVPLLTV